MKKADKERLKHLKIRSNEHEDLESKNFHLSFERYIKLWDQEKR